MSRMDKIGKTATQVYAQGMTEIVRYHNTNVVEICNDIIILNSDGWRTNTTKNRMNQASYEFRLDYKVYQSLGKWYVNYGGINWPYRDHMVLDRIAKNVRD